MQKVSDSWKSMYNRQLVNESFIEISFEVADPDALADATSTDNGSVYYADTNLTVSTSKKTIVPYGTLEENLWLLDGNHKILPSNETDNDGYVGEMLSGVDGSFSTIPIIDVEFSKTHTKLISGITITWGEAHNEYPAKFRVIAFNGSEIVAETTVANNTAVKSIVEMDIQNYNKITIEILKWCLPNHRPRISTILLGRTKTYTKADTTKYEHSQDVSPISATTPNNTISFSIDNTDEEYNPLNENGVSKYLMERQEIKVRYGLKLDGGDIEYIDGGVFYLSEWDAPQNGIVANFVARDLFEFLRNDYDTLKLYSAKGTNLYDLAVTVLTDANLPKDDEGKNRWVISDSLKDIATQGVIPEGSFGSCLQYIAQAGMCALWCDRQGILHLEPLNEPTSDYTLNSLNLYSKPEIALQKPLKAVSVKIYTHSLGDDGKIVSESSELIVETDAVEGEIQAIDNPLIYDEQQAEQVANWVIRWLGNRKMLSIGEWRADPRLDANDVVTYTNKYGTGTVRVTSVKYSYAGSFKGSAEGRLD